MFSAREARMAANGGSHTAEEWEAQKLRQMYRCYNPSCQCDLRYVVIHKDHMIPVVRGGTDNIINIRALCGPCNLRKGWKTWAEFRESEKARDRRLHDYDGEGQHCSEIGRSEWRPGSGGGWRLRPGGPPSRSTWAIVQALCILSFLAVITAGVHSSTDASAVASAGAPLSSAPGIATEGSGLAAEVEAPAAPAPSVAWREVARIQEQVWRNCSRHVWVQEQRMKYPDKVVPWQRWRRRCMTGS
jgi:HNH endonuclease